MLFKKRYKKNPKTININEYINYNRTLRDLIELIYLKNSKGNNGLIVKGIKEECFPEELKFVENEIEKVNTESFEEDIFNKSSTELYAQFEAKAKKEFNYSIAESRLEQLFTLFTMNYVFSTYKNRRFRRFLGIKK
ncbi:hypothetical protein [Pontibacillus marinus]|uniref:Uncharacterized protein n=1 Tax=Pontibacillus marinus BH030004 = DSM 16465 TaxID=1385511 RepID=A0A0A5GHD8_9BACI|nr:hypothetical protein [Pontibacillus marinus]KGX90495.1 hypothetical protein N783_16710 [Pontibacillus marinus BH030004 = DSM 16465]